MEDFEGVADLLGFVDSTAHDICDDGYWKSCCDGEHDRDDDAYAARHGKGYHKSKVEYGTLGTKGEGKSHAEDECSEWSVATDDGAGIVAVVVMMVVMTEGSEEQVESNDDEYVWHYLFALAYDEFEAFDIFAASYQTHEYPTEQDICDGAAQCVE